MRVSTGATFEGTNVGGLSAITYDPGRDLYYVISDDRSAHNAARFYTARNRLSGRTVGDVQFVATHPWLDADGQPFRAVVDDRAPRRWCRPTPRAWRWTAVAGSCTGPARASDAPTDGAPER